MRAETRVVPSSRRTVMNNAGWMNPGRFRYTTIQFESAGCMPAAVLPRGMAPGIHVMNAAPGLTDAPPNRLLLGPGPSLVHPRVLHALALPPIGHLDPAFLTILDEVQQLLRDTFRTSNPLTFPISGTGSAGMEAAVANVIEPGDIAVVGVNGAFGARLAAMVERCGGRVWAVEASWGSIIEPDAIRDALAKAGRVKMVAVVHAETSTGVAQPLDGLSHLCRRYDALLLVDAVTSLAGMPLDVDAWGIDICYSGTQKCLSCPPGLAPITVGPRARIIAEEARDAGLPAAAVVELDDAEQALGHLRRIIQRGDVVLLKGSRGVHLDRIVPALEVRP